MKALRNSSAFTLVEVIISLLILASISILTSQSIRNSSEVKRKVQANVDRRSKFRAAIKLIEKDVQLAFHYRDYSRELYEKINKEQATAAEKTNTTDKKETNTTNGESQDPDKKTDKTETVTDKVTPIKIDLDKLGEGVDKTQFLGQKDQMHFTNLNNVRTNPTAIESSQQEVGYYVKACRNRFDPQLSYNCLWRRTNPAIDDDVSDGGNEFVLLENIKVFKIRYRGKNKDDWVEVWMTDDRGDDITKNTFPDLVEVSLSFEENKKLEEAIITIPIRFPNNQEKSDADSNTGNPNAK